MDHPTYENVPYGPDPINVLDLYCAETSDPAPLYIYNHGGGFCGGDKNEMQPDFRAKLLKAGISVAGVNYRLSETAPYPAAMTDCVRGLQFLRHKAGEWNLDPTRVAAGGGSAGGGITFWIGFNQDFADPSSDDPVERESSALTCIACWNTQSSYDPNYIRTIIKGTAYRVEVLQTFFRVKPEQYEEPRFRRQFEEASALNIVTAEAPPTFVWYPTDNVMPDDIDDGHGIHHPRFGEVLKEKMDTLGGDCTIRFREDLPADFTDTQVWEHYHTEVVDFVKQHFNMA
ncbi:alpha/beta hydrolase fold domain-containing protein [Planctomycetota bacterium]